MTDTLVRDRRQPKHRQRRRGSRFRTLLFVGLLVALGLVASGVLPVKQYLERENQVADAQDQLDTLKTDNAALSESADALLSDQEVERIARVQYGFVRPGEVGYTVITPEDDEASGQAPEAVAPVVDERGFFERIWDFITGGDDAPDG